MLIDKAEKYQYIIRESIVNEKSPISKISNLVKCQEKLLKDFEKKG